jgi:HSP20 family molecular chaperone IbpA
MTAPASVQEYTKEREPRIVNRTEIESREAEILDAIQRRAYEIFENRGRGLGQDVNDWLIAEAEVLHPAHLNVTQSDITLVIRLDMPGFEAKDIRVSIEPYRVIISGEKRQEEKRETEKMLYSETCSDRIYQLIDLSGEVDDQDAKMTLKNGVLEIRLRKVPSN